VRKIPTPLKIRNLEERLRAEKDRCQQLETQLAASTFHQLETVQTVFQQELDTVYLAAGPVAAGPGNMEQLSDFSFQQLQQQFSKYAPQLTETIQSLGRHSCTRSNVLDIHNLAVLSILAKKKDDKLKGLQLLISLMMVARSVSKRVFDTFNHLGLCLSYSQTWDYVRKFAKEISRAIQLKEGTWIIAYDNINIHEKVQHERTFRYSEAWDFTSRLALQVVHTPPPALRMTAALPQKDRTELSPEDIMPNDDDEALFCNRAQIKVKQILVTHFAAFYHLKDKVVDPALDCAAQASVLHPLSLMFVNNSIIDNNVEILCKIKDELGIDGSKQQCIVGDQATCVTIRGARKRRIAEPELPEQLRWAKENPGDFHFMWECLKVIFLLF
jgi:hypothetical protein